jgi:hypothetical protein
MNYKSVKNIVTPKYGYIFSLWLERMRKPKSVLYEYLKLIKLLKINEIT